MTTADHEARQGLAKLEGQFDGHLDQCGERYKALRQANERLRDAIKGLYDRWWWIMTTMIVGMGAILAKDFFIG